MNDDEDDFIFTQEVLDHIDKAITQKEKPPRKSICRTTSLDKNFTNAPRGFSIPSTLPENNIPEQIGQLKQELQKKCGEYSIYKDSSEKLIKKQLEKISKLEKDIEIQNSDHNRTIAALKTQLDFKESDLKSISCELERLKFASKAKTPAINVNDHFDSPSMAILSQCTNLPLLRSPQTTTKSFKKMDENLSVQNHFHTPTKRRKIAIEDSFDMFNQKPVMTDSSCLTDPFFLPQQTKTVKSITDDFYLDRILILYSSLSYKYDKNDRYLHSIYHFSKRIESTLAIITIFQLCSHQLIEQVINIIEYILKDEKLSASSDETLADISQEDCCLIEECRLRNSLDDFSTEESDGHLPTNLGSMTENSFIDDYRGEELDPFAGAPASQAVSVVNYSSKGRDSSGSIRKSINIKVDKKFKLKDRLLSNRLRIIIQHVALLKEAFARLDSRHASDNLERLIIQQTAFFRKIFFLLSYGLCHAGGNVSDDRIIILYETSKQFLGVNADFLVLLSHQTRISFTNLPSPILLINFGLTLNSRTSFMSRTERIILASNWFSECLHYLTNVEFDEASWHNGIGFWNINEDNLYTILDKFCTLINDFNLDPNGTQSMNPDPNVTSNRTGFVNLTDHNKTALRDSCPSSISDPFTKASQICPIVVLSNIVGHFLNELRTKSSPPLHQNTEETPLTEMQEAFIKLFKHYCDLVSKCCTNEPLIDPNSHWPEDCVCKSVVYMTLISCIPPVIDECRQLLRRSFEPSSHLDMLATWSRTMKNLFDLDGEVRFQRMTDKNTIFFFAIKSTRDLAQIANQLFPNSLRNPYLIIDFLIDFDI